MILGIIPNRSNLVRVTHFECGQRGIDAWKPTPWTAIFFIIREKNCKTSEKLLTRASKFIASFVFLFFCIQPAITDFSIFGRLIPLEINLLAIITSFSDVLQFFSRFIKKIAVRDLQKPHTIKSEPRRTQLDVRSRAAARLSSNVECVRLVNSA